ncbi:hypothetical protein QAD02_003122 [Eretmocerus hayati]|uniref:Uncharacterized protein n=1 Tax=Eretmocerus hayati TaxID=131215 RepID=A0ACC2NLU3_9HYME|nr:hypothetical protein QAD02_003122 [Eretmocerus hayati]
MGVFLATQVLSNSTSVALDLFEYSYKFSRFQGASATSKFCAKLNASSDLLNSKSKFCKTPGRRAITEEALLELEDEAEKYTEYIKKLEVDVPVKPKEKASEFKKKLLRVKMRMIQGMNGMEIRISSTSPTPRRNK